MLLCLRAVGGERLPGPADDGGDAGDGSLAGLLTIPPDRAGTEHGATLLSRSSTKPLERAHDPTGVARRTGAARKSARGSPRPSSPAASASCLIASAVLESASGRKR
jgi:hypothetical protein